MLYRQKTLNKIISHDLIQRTQHKKRPKFESLRFPQSTCSYLNKGHKVNGTSPILATPRFSNKLGNGSQTMKGEKAYSKCVIGSDHRLHCFFSMFVFIAVL